MRTLLLLTLLILNFVAYAQTPADIAAKPIDQSPWVIYPKTFNSGDEISATVKPTVIDLDGQTVDIYITADRNENEWNADPSLIDVRSTGAQNVMLSGATTEESIVILQNTTELLGISEARPGVAYDLVYDVNQDGLLNDGDLIDGIDRVGFFVVDDMELTGPYGVDSLYYQSEEGYWQTFRLFYPTEIESLEAQPLVVISHGWTHHYWYYDFLGQHLASYGYVVMSHRNDVGNGGALASTTASTSALENIDTLLTIYPELAGGLLDGKIDKNRIVHAGHST
ncbi:MAG: hypothetical protein HKN32_00715, partial [Flavobacteriales bacterium]|nr:hypothetical protein [Flavobacteriales bacterium]